MAAKITLLSDLTHSKVQVNRKTTHNII